MQNFKIIALGVAVIVGVAATLLIRQRAMLTLREHDAASGCVATQLTELVVKNQHLSNELAQVANSTASALSAELVKLRKEAEKLRKQRDERAKQVTESRRSPSLQSTASTNADLAEYEVQLRNAASAKMDDAHTLTWALGKYAFEHQNTFPSNFAQVATYLAARPASFKLSGTNEFEIVYSGSRNEWANIPWGVVAVIRERQAWLTPNGNWARVYGMGDY